MSKYLLFPLVSILLGCMSTPESEFGISDHPIEFDTYMGRQARAVEKSSFDSGDSFLVYASRSMQANTSMASSFDGAFFVPSGSGGSSLFVTKQPSGALTPDRKVFWPESGYLDFLSVMQNTPASAYSISFAPAELTFHQQQAATDQVDLLLAVATGRSSSPNPVNMNFRHILSKLQFSAQIDHPDDNYMAKILSVTVRNVRMTGVYNFTGQTEDGVTVGTWRVDEATEPDNCLAGLLQTEVNNAQATFLSVADGSLMLIPQAATSLYIEYELYYNTALESANSYVKLSTESRIVDLSQSLWRAGKLYRYLLKIKPQAELNFSCTMGGWQDDSESDVPSVYPPQPI